MGGKPLVWLAATAFASAAFAISLFEVHGARRLSGPAPARPVVGTGDALAVQLRACSVMGEAALSAPACRAAWREKRRRFFGNAAPRRDPLQPHGRLPAKAN